MKNDLYFKHDAGASSNRKIMHLIDELGMKGYGAYWLLQETLRMQQNYRAPLNIVRRLARRARVMPAYLLQVIENYDLFIVDKEYFYSPGMTRRMRAYDLKTSPTVHEEVPPDTPKTLEMSKTVPPNARVIRDNKRKEEESPVSTWESCIDAAFCEQSWLEVISMHSGLGMQLMEQLPAIKDFFKRHVRTYGKENSVFSVSDAKSYFGNFIRQGTPTLKALQAELKKGERKVEKENPYRYEEQDLQTGQRTYCGQVIPPEAPPRPSENAVWSDKLQEWSE